jgi:hypothetical protein
MNCQIFETVVNDLAREQIMEAKTREEALAHSGACEACALRLSLERRLTFGLRALAAEMKSESASPRVEEELLKAFRSQTSSVPGMPLSSRRRWAVAAAAVVLVGFGMAGIKWWLSGPSQIAIESNNNGAATAQAIPVAIGHPTSGPTPKQTPGVYRPRRKPSVRSSEKRSSGGNEPSVAKRGAGETNTTAGGNSEESDVTTQFLPLSYASPVSLQDGGQLVRVELPRSAMARFGLPVNMERYDERVKADVLLSADGLARAIRFVQ